MSLCITETMVMVHELSELFIQMDQESIRLCTSSYQQQQESFD